MGPGNAVTPKVRSQVFKKESDQIVKHALYLIRQGTMQQAAVPPTTSIPSVAAAASASTPDLSLFYDSVDEGFFLARKMFEVAWPSALVSLSSVLSNAGIYKNLNTAVACTPNIWVNYHYYYY